MNDRKQLLSPEQVDFLTEMMNVGAGNAATQNVALTMNNDTAVEGNETVELSLGTITGPATAGSPSSHTHTITDNDGATNTTHHHITITNTPPTATFTYTPPSPTTADTIHFTDLSTDSDGTIINHT